jgi:hypothetical protein
MGRAQAFVVLAVLSGISGQGDAQVLKALSATLGGGIGWAQLSCSNGNCPGRVSDGGAATAVVQVGANLGRRVWVGGEFANWSKQISGVRDRLTNVSLTVSCYPLRRSRAFVQGGVGRGYVRWVNAGVITFKGTGSALLFGVGLDVPIRSNLSLRPAITYHKSDMTPEARTDYMWRESLWVLGATVTMHP